MHAETETSFLANLNRNIGIVHQVCHTYFRRDPVEREDLFQDIMYQLWKPPKRWRRFTTSATIDGSFASRWSGHHASSVSVALRLVSTKRSPIMRAAKV